MTDYDPTTSYRGLANQYITWLLSKRPVMVVVLSLYLITAYGVAFVDYTPWFAFPYWQYVYAVVALWGICFSVYYLIYPPEVDG